MVVSVAILSYLATRLGGALVIRPEMIWPLWPGCAFLVAVLLLIPRKILARCSFGWGCRLRGLRRTGSTADPRNCLLSSADSIEILVAGLGVSYVFGGVLRLNSVKALVKYAPFAVILAPLLSLPLPLAPLKGIPGGSDFLPRRWLY